MDSFFPFPSDRCEKKFHTLHINTLNAILKKERKKKSLSQNDTTGPMEDRKSEFSRGTKSGISSHVCKIHMLNYSKLYTATTLVVVSVLSFTWLERDFKRERADVTKGKDGGHREKEERCPLVTRRNTVTSN